MKLRGTPVQLIERAYATLDAPREEWLDGLREEAEKLFDGVSETAQAWEFRITRTGAYKTVGLSTTPFYRASFHAAHAVMPKAISKKGYLTGPVPCLLDTLGGDVNHPVYRAMTAVGVSDMAGAIGVDPSGMGIAISWFRPATGPLSREVRNALERISAHVTSALRLRNRGGEAEVDAVLDPGGKLLHAERDARDEATRESLREAAVRIDRARTRRVSAEIDEPAALWNALVDGSWSLVERFESDGRRLLVARRNDPTTHQTRALTENEKKVVALIALGHSPKLVAYELGFTESWVSALLKSAMAKMGVENRAALVELQGAIVDQE